MQETKANKLSRGPFYDALWIRRFVLLNAVLQSVFCSLQCTWVVILPDGSLVRTVSDFSPRYRDVGLLVNIERN